MLHVYVSPNLSIFGNIRLDTMPRIAIYESVMQKTLGKTESRTDVMGMHGGVCISFIPARRTGNRNDTVIIASIIFVKNHRNWLVTTFVCCVKYYYSHC